MAKLAHRAVLTGDIIRSSRLERTAMEAVRSSLLHATSVVRRWKRGTISGKLEFFRGDGWQLVVTHPAMALRIGVFLRASLLATGLADTRIAIGLGEVDASSPRRTSLSTGPAFALSGRALDTMTQYANMTIEVPKSAGVLSSWLPLIGHLCDSLIEQWTQRQSEIVCAVIDPREPDYETVSQTIVPVVSKQAVAKALKGANWHVVREAIHQFEETPWKEIL